MHSGRSSAGSQPRLTSAQESRYVLPPGAKAVINACYALRCLQSGTATLSMSSLLVEAHTYHHHVMSVFRAHLSPCLF